MNSPGFEQKVRRLFKQDRVLRHYTSANNAVSALVHGLKPLEKLIEEGIEFERGAANYASWFPDLVSFDEVENAILSKNTITSISHIALYVENKYIALKKEDHIFSHPALHSEVPPKDILAILLRFNPSFPLEQKKEASYIMEMQRQLVEPENWTPIYFRWYDSEYVTHCDLYIPEWLKVTDDITRIVEERNSIL